MQVKKMKLMMILLLLLMTTMIMMVVVGVGWWCRCTASSYYFSYEMNMKPIPFQEGKQVNTWERDWVDVLAAFVAETETKMS